MASLRCYVVFAVFTLFAIIQIATPIRCFVCSTVSDGKACEDAFNKTAHTADTCDDPKSVCAKEVLAALGKFNESIHRSCVNENYCKQHEKIVKHCSTCKTDECNSSLTITPSFSILALITVYYSYNSLTR